MTSKEIPLTIAAFAIISILMSGLTLTVTKKYNYKEKPAINSIQITTYTIKIEESKALKSN